jgi:hypothetical protein
MTVFTSLLVALLFAAIFLFGSRLAYRPGQRGRRRFLSFAAGIAVSYVFVDVLPALGRMQGATIQYPGDFYRIFPEYSVYLWAMAGFMAYYCLETMVVRPRRVPQDHAVGTVGAATWQAWVHIGGFAAYAWLLTYLMVWKGHSTLALCLYAVAMGMHVFPIVGDLSCHYPAAYDRRGACLLALASLAGWASGLALEIPKPILLNLVAVLAGGVIVNTAIAELPKEREGRFWSFLSGTAIYTALLLVLSHAEKE